MGHDPTDNVPDLVRWSFTIDPSRRAEVEGHLDDLGAEVSVRGDGRFTVLWEEPDLDLDEVLEALWAIQGAPFEVTHEVFQRLVLHTLQYAEEEGAALGG